MTEASSAGPQQKATALRGLVPLASVADVAASADFYKLLGFKVENTFEQDGRVQWAWLKNGGANLMLGRFDHPKSPDTVGFYLYVDDLAPYRNELESKGVKVGPIEYPFYSPRGEFRVEDPDGYVLYVTHADEE